MADDGFKIPKKKRLLPRKPAAADEQDDDPLLSSLLGDDHPSPAAPAASASPLTPAPQHATPPLQTGAPGHESEAGTPAKKKKKKKEKKEKREKRQKRRLLVPGAGHCDAFLYALRAAGVEGHEYEEYVMYDSLEAVVGAAGGGDEQEEDVMAQTQARLFAVLEMRFGEIVQHDKENHTLEFHLHERHYIKYHYQCNPATLTPEELGTDDIFLTAFARRPGLRLTGAPGTYAPGFNPAAWAEGVYLEGSRRVFVCEPPGPKGKKGPLASAIPAQANALVLSSQAGAWAARLPVRDRNVLRDVVTHEQRMGPKKKGGGGGGGGVFSDSDDEVDGRYKRQRGRKTPTKRPSPAQAAKKKGGTPAAAAASIKGKGKGKGKGKEGKKPKHKTVALFNPFVR